MSHQKQENKKSNFSKLNFREIFEEEQAEREIEEQLFQRLKLGTTFSKIEAWNTFLNLDFIEQKYSGSVKIVEV